LYHYSPGEFHLTPLDSHVQVLELELGDFLAEDQVYFCGAVRSAVAPAPLIAPPAGSRFLQLSRERPFVLFIYVHLFVLSQLRLSGDVILL